MIIFNTWWNMQSHNFIQQYHFDMNLNKFCPGGLVFEIWYLYKSSSIIGGMLHVPRGGPTTFPPENSKICSFNYKHEKFVQLISWCNLLWWLLHIFFYIWEQAEDPKRLASNCTSPPPLLLILPSHIKSCLSYKHGDLHTAFWKFHTFFVSNNSF